MTQPSTSAPSGARFEPAGPPGPPAPTSPAASVWEDFVDIFYAPSDVYARREKGGFWAPMLVVAVVTGLIFAASKGVLQPMIDAEMDREMAKAVAANPQAAQAGAAMRGFAETMMTVMAFVGIPILVFVSGFLLWLVGKLFDARQSLKTTVMVAAYATVPFILQSVLVALQALLLDPASLDGRYRLSLGAARFLDPDTTPPLTMALLGPFDVFTLWFAVLCAIGLSVTGKISRSRAAIAAAIVFVLGALPGVVSALRR